MSFGSAAVQIADYFALSLCVGIFLLSLPGFPGIPSYLSAAFCLIVPGYAFTRAFLRGVPILASALIIVGFSVSMVAFTSTFLDVMLRQSDIPMLLVLDVGSFLLLAWVILKSWGEQGLLRSQFGP